MSGDVCNPSWRSIDWEDFPCIPHATCTCVKCRLIVILFSRNCLSIIPAQPPFIISSPSLNTLNTTVGEYGGQLVITDFSLYPFERQNKQLFVSRFWTSKLRPQLFTIKLNNEQDFRFYSLTPRISPQCSLEAQSIVNLHFFWVIYNFVST